MFTMKQEYIEVFLKALCSQKCDIVCLFWLKIARNQHNSVLCFLVHFYIVIIVFESVLFSSSYIIRFYFSLVLLV